MVAVPSAGIGDDEDAGRLITFINIGHALDHFVLLIFPTAMIAYAQETGIDYASLLALATGAFVAFGVLSLPVGFLANWIGRRTMFAIYFFGTAFALAGMSTAQSNTAFAVWLFIMGSFAAIYHPVGGAMLAANVPAGRFGRTLARNGVWGNLGAASAPILTATLASTIGWRSAFLVPAAVALVVGIAFVVLMPNEVAVAPGSKGKSSHRFPEQHVYTIAAAFMVAVAAGGATFNMLSVALPKVIDERLGLDLPLWLIGSLATFVFLFGAFTQLNVGRWIEKLALPRLFLILGVMQPLGFAIASVFTGVPLLIGLLITIAAIYGNVLVIDAIVARYVPDEQRTRAYGIRYFLGFAASGFAVPLISYLHGYGGFPLVLVIAGVFGFCLFLSAVFVYRLMTSGEQTAL